MSGSAWDKSEFGSGNNNKASQDSPISDIFLKVGSGKHQIRLVGDPKPIMVAWINGKKYIVPDDAYARRVKELFDVPSIKNYAINVIDRDDQAERVAKGESPRFKILEKGNSIFDSILTHYREELDDNGNRIPPGGPLGQDWKIIATKTGPKAQNTKYNVVSSKQTPFTAEEKKLIAKTEKHEKIKDLLKPEEYERVVNGKFYEKFKGDPIGEKGLIDLDAFYNLEKNKKKLDDLFAEHGSGKVSSPPSAPSAKKVEVETEEDFGIELEEESSPVAEKASAPVASPPSTMSDEELDSMF